MHPEEAELSNKKKELELLESELAQNELDLSTLKAELRAFNDIYVRIVGVRYAELDLINCAISEAVAAKRT